MRIEGSRPSSNLRICQLAKMDISSKIIFHTFFHCDGIFDCRLSKDNSKWPETSKRGEISQKPKNLAKLTVKVYPQILKLHRRFASWEPGLGS